MKRCRLTCRRFANIADSYLFPGVRVKLDHASLERLEAIAQHPVISKSVKTVRFDLSLYKKSLSSNLDRFGWFCTTHLQWELNRRADEMTTWQDRWDCPDRRYLEPVDKVDEALTTVLEVWNTLVEVIEHDPTPVLDERPESHQYKPFWDFLRAQQQEYSQWCRKQQQLLTTDEFFPRVAAAVAKMPCANTIQFHDLDIKNGPKLGLPFNEVDPRDPCKALKRHGFLLQPEPLLYWLVVDEDLYFIPFIGQMLWALRQAGSQRPSIYFFRVQIVKGTSTTPPHSLPLMAAQPFSASILLLGRLCTSWRASLWLFMKTCSAAGHLSGQIWSAFLPLF
jgi:hypothetical protein